MERPLDGMHVAVLATDGFEQSELEEPRRALQEAGADVRVISMKPGSIRGWKHTDWGNEVNVDLTLDAANPSQFEGLVLPGGVMNPDRLRMDPAAVRFVSAMWESGRPIAAICHGPWTLIEAGVAQGRRMTSWPSLRTDLLNAGATWVDEPAVRDSRLVTSRKPQDLPEFNAEMIALFRDERSRVHRAA